MIKYRPHRGALADAMKEACEFESYEELKAHVVEEWKRACDFLPEAPFTEEDVVIGDVLGDDSRIGWKSVRYVCVKRIGKEIYETPQCVGFCGE